jgi:hypothetical protein
MTLGVGNQPFDVGKTPIPATDTTSVSPGDARSRFTHYVNAVMLPKDVKVGMARPNSD